MSGLDAKILLHDALKSRGFDGLYSDHFGCGCKLDDLAPCEGGYDGVLKCVPGKLVEGCSDECGEGCDWHIAAADGQPNVSNTEGPPMEDENEQG